MQQDRIQSRWHTVLIIALIFAALFFLYRGVWRGINTGGADFSGRYAMTRALLHGADPYDRAVQQTFMEHGGGDPEGWISSPVDPPSALMVYLPFALLPWSVAAPAFSLTGLGLYLLACLTVVRWLGLQKHRFAAGIFLCLALVFSPTHTMASVCNPVLLAGPLIILGVALASMNRQAAGGILLGVAIATKPQLAIPMLAFFIARRRWLSLSAGAGTASLLLAVGVLWVMPINSNWFSDMKTTALAMSGLNVSIDQGIGRFDRIHAEILLNLMFEQPRTSALAAKIIVCLTGMLWLIIALKRFPSSIKPEMEVLVLMPLLAMNLLVVYHRPYDAVILLPVLGAAIVWMMAPRMRTIGILILFSLVPFLVIPWSSTMIQIFTMPWFPESIKDSTLTHVAILALPVWSLIAVLVVGVFALFRHRTIPA